MIVEELLTKKPFYKVMPPTAPTNVVASNLNNRFSMSDDLRYNIIPQTDFIREYYPSGHKINSPVFFPNRIKYDEKRGQFFEEKVFRIAFPFQFIITTQHLVHLCGNDLVFELTPTVQSEELKAAFTDVKQGWLDKNMEIALFRFFRSALITGDSALVQYIHKGKCGWKVLSSLDGDVLFPHYDSITGQLSQFARKFQSFDETGKSVCEYVEVWDDTYYYLYRKSNGAIQNGINRLKNYLGMSGYELVQRTMHGFKQIPVAYKRFDQGACWSFVQHLIENFEISVSHLCQSNMAYAFPIMVLKGESVDIQGDIYGAVKAITMGQDDDAKYLEQPNSSAAFELQLKTILDMIFMGSFIVKPPEVRSGDLPGVAIKLIYSPSIEIATTEAKEFDDAIDSIVRTFKFAYGVERDKVTEYSNLDIFTWIEPYIHQNSSELINNLVQSVSADILSKETAADKTTYGTNDEVYRLIKQRKEQELHNLL